MTMFRLRVVLVNFAMLVSWPCLVLYTGGKRWPGPDYRQTRRPIDRETDQQMQLSALQHFY